MQLDSFIRFYPSRGQLITYENLPNSHFNKELNHIINQTSNLKLQLIQNLEWTKKVIEDIYDFYKDEWDAKRNALLTSNS